MASAAAAVDSVGRIVVTALVVEAVVAAAVVVEVAVAVDSRVSSAVPVLDRSLNRIRH